MASHTTSPPDRGIVAHPPPEHVRISPARQRVGLSFSVVGVAFSSPCRVLGVSRGLALSRWWRIDDRQRVSPQSLFPHLPAAPQET